ncbi:TRL-like family protein [Candidatus Nitrospira allomarina]|jgi:TRL (tRNA-associated locus)-like protein|uniref:TRL-like family protein n=1 Tax=Candidatus Nitrospira allomarina TaxID=3020900 RepID=A0AA96JZP2_9BACT|nr:TRL-like family protein [Candidatus Nitrospira allomarina]WNM58859.1 TRL-like family protein [Candidatus Nitrospira allomarina]
MKNLLMAGFLGFCLLNLSGCMGVASPVAGWAYTEAKFGNQVTDGPAGTKTGTACATSILAMVATGDASQEKAMANGGITQITYVDHSAKNILGIWGEWCTIVHGS